MYHSLAGFTIEYSFHTTLPNQENLTEEEMANIMVDNKNLLQISQSMTTKQVTMAVATYCLIDGELLKSNLHDPFVREKMTSFLALQGPIRLHDTGYYLVINNVSDNLDTEVKEPMCD